MASTPNYPDQLPEVLLENLATFHLIPTGPTPFIYHTLINRLDRMALFPQYRNDFLWFFSRSKPEVHRRVYEIVYQDCRIRNTYKHLTLLWPMLDKDVKAEFWADRLTPDEREVVITHAYWGWFAEDCGLTGIQFDPETEANASWIWTQEGKRRKLNPTDNSSGSSTTTTDSPPNIDSYLVDPRIADLLDSSDLSD